jgi:UDP-N-acetylglucosamine 2-epimerase
MKTFYLASRNRASDGAISHLKTELKKQGMLGSVGSSDYIIAVGDRKETFDIVLQQWRLGVPIIHLWAGEHCSDWATEDEVYRSSLSLMSMMQLCTNPTAYKRVVDLCNATGKEPDAYVVGNVMLDDMKTDSSKLPSFPYILVLYNPPTLVPESVIKSDLIETQFKISELKSKYKLRKYIWIEPNGDKQSDLVLEHSNQKNLPRPQFLGLLKNCRFFITNSSCQFYEAPFFLKPDQIIPIGKRNSERDSKNADMTMTGATEKIISLLEKL